jgi:hypothetical protein
MSRWAAGLGGSAQQAGNPEIRRSQQPTPTLKATLVAQFMMGKVGRLLGLRVQGKTKVLTTLAA